METCPGCGAVVPTVDARTHRYLGASPGCWALYMDVLAREYSEYTPVHQLTVDAYSVQHPGVRSRRAAKSTGVHLMGLCLALECRFPPSGISWVLSSILARDPHFPWLPPPAEYETTILEVQRSRTSPEHDHIVHRFAQTTWQAWSPHHHTIRALLQTLAGLTTKHEPLAPFSTHGAK